jgi:hypothetical protein
LIRINAARPDRAESPVGIQRDLNEGIMPFARRGRIMAAFERLRLGALALALAAGASPALAVPSFAVQTGQPCQACHVGGFGPQLTPFGRAFKIRGYTMRANSFNVPLSAMAMASYINTAKGQTPPPRDFASNDNLAIDQISLFIAGGLGSHLGAFIQTTYDGIARAFHWDNLDVRAVTDVQVRGADVVLGASLNNAPTVQDAWNTTPAWGFPYSTSALAPSPSASPLLNGALAQTSLGLTGYAWINSEFYLEAGGYGSPGATSLTRLGADPTSPGSIRGIAPYARLAFQHDLRGGTFEAGLFGMRADIYPGLDRSLGLSDGYADVGLDGSYIRNVRGGADTVTVDGRYVHERQTLRYTCAQAALDPGAAGLACPGHVGLDDMRLSASYYWRNRIGATVALFDTTGSTSAYLYNYLGGQRLARPDSRGVTLQLDATPFGGGASPLGPRVNLRVGMQYTAYAAFNGAASNYDGAGAKASDNNSFRIFTWLAF